MTTSDQPQRPSGQPGVSPLPRRKHVLQVPDDILHRYNARVLDPSTAEQIPGQPPVKSTVYIGNQLIISGDASEEALRKLAEAAAAKGLRVVIDEDDCHAKTHRLARATGREEHLFFSRSVRLEPAGTGPAAPPDAWSVLQTYRAAVGLDDKQGRHAVALDHLMLATPDIGGLPEIAGHGITGLPEIAGHGTVGLPEIAGHGTRASDVYGLPGFGARAPVEWVGPAPRRRRDDELPCRRRPVVAVLDTGAGSHPWLGNSIVTRNLFVNGIPVGIHEPTTNPENTGVLDDPFEGTLDSDSGHGTFIAGLIRQKCPDANILAVRVMSSDGAVPESILLDALKLLLLRHSTAQAEGDITGLIDVINLSLGYYHEQSEDLLYDPQLLAPLRALSACGVIVVASAGNDATSRPMFPAAFTPYADGQIAGFDHDHVPLLSVGALNPNRTIALFSNAGPWVTCHRPGAGLVSTFPTTFNGSAQPAFRVDVPGDGRREAMDLDNFHCGFGTWSGTSFAAPILAGELAQSILDGGCGPVDAYEVGSCVDRAWSAVFEQTQVRRP